MDATGVTGTDDLVKLVLALPHASDREMHDSPLGLSRSRRLRRAFIMHEAMMRRGGGMWPTMNRGQAGAARAARLLRYLRGGAE